MMPQLFGKSASSPRKPPRPASAGSPRWQSHVPFWGLGQAEISAESNPFTFGENFSLSGSYTAIQLILVNSGPVQPLGGMLVAPSASRLPASSPCDASGRPVPWTEVTLHGERPVLPEGPSLGRPWVGLSDPVAVRSLERSDGGRFPLLFTRVLSPTGTLFHPTILATLPGALELYDQDSGGRGVDCYFVGGDFVTDRALRGLLTDQIADRNCMLSFVAGVRFLSEEPGLTILGAGDSLTSGYVNGSGFNGFGLRASIELSERHKIAVSHVANAFPGQCSFDFIGNAMVAIDVLKPDIVTIPIDSPNDYALIPPTLAGPVSVGMQQRALDLMSYATANDAIPVLVTPIPFGYYDEPERYGALRAESGAIARTLASGSAIVLDAQAAISGYIPTADRVPDLPPHFRAWDNAHLNDEAQRVIGAELARLLDPICREVAIGGKAGAGAGAGAGVKVKVGAGAGAKARPAASV